MNTGTMFYIYLIVSKCPKSVSSVGDDVSNEGQHNFY